MNKRYNITGKVDAIDRAFELSRKLEAMLMQTYANAGEEFRGMNHDLQANFMWACGDMAHELRACMDIITEPTEPTREG